MAEIIEITDSNFDQIIESTELPVVVVFGAAWSTACLMLMDNIAEAMEQVGDFAVWATVDLDKEHKLAERFSIITMPTMLVIHQKQIAKQYFGVQEVDMLIEMVKEFSPKQPETTTA